MVPCTCHKNGAVLSEMHVSFNLQSRYVNSHLCVIHIKFFCCSVPSVVWSHDQAEEKDHWWRGDGGLLKENKLMTKHGKREREREHSSLLLNVLYKLKILAGN